MKHIAFNEPLVGGKKFPSRVWWFTLVELVVVITILAILGTVALLSFRGYSGDARNSKRVTDLHNIKSRIIEQITAGQKMLNFVTSVAENRLASSPSIAWATPANGTDYEAGTLNYTTIGMIQEDFSDPTTNNSYAIWISTKYKWWAYQVAAKMDPVDDANNRTYMMGNFKPRATTSVAATTANTSTTTITLTNGTSVGLFKVGDTISCTPACAPATRTISKIAANGVTLTANTAPGVILTNIALAAAESSSLIDENNPTATADAAIVHDSSTLFPY